MMSRRSLLSLVFCSQMLSACGLYAPSKNPFVDDKPNEAYKSASGRYENGIVNHVQCELANALYTAYQAFDLPWLETWGTSVTLTITSLDQSGSGVGVSVINPLPNSLPKFPVGGPVTLAQSFSASFGASASANATRTETIQFTYLNASLLRFAREHTLTQVNWCAFYLKSVMIDGDLKIREFVYDKAQIANLGNASLFYGEGKKAFQHPIYNTLTEEINFVGTYGGSFTPTWKLARVTANTSSNLLAAMRTNTNDLIITIGPVKRPLAKDAPIELGTSAQNQHNARVAGSAIATSIQGQAH